jgi:transposase
MTTALGATPAEPPPPAPEAGFVGQVGGLGPASMATPPRPDSISDADLGGDRAPDPAPPSPEAVAAEDVAVGQGAPRRGLRRSGSGSLRPGHAGPLRPDEVVLCADEMTSLQPRPRKSQTLAAKKDRPTRVEHDYGRCGAWNLFAVFDTRTGKVSGQTAGRTRQSEFLAFLEHLDREIPASVTTIHIVLDNLRMHKDKQVQAWLAQHPRFVFHHPPVPCSWMNQVEQWFGILKRKRLRIADFASKEHLAERLMALIHEWNQTALPFNWTSKSVAKVMAECQTEDAKPLAAVA